MRTPDDRLSDVLGMVRHVAGAIRVANSRPRHVPARRPAGLRVSDPERHDAKVWIVGEGLPQVRGEVRVWIPAIVVEKEDHIARGLGDASVAASGDSEILGELQEIGRAHV